MHSVLVFGTGPLMMLAVAIAVASTSFAAEAVVKLVRPRRSGPQPLS